ncbi:MAG: error-prone DNA polymerase, partial [Rhodobacterales bacterium]|nr:error-prone DNA polymerase [Rhodobacterales bacterium]MDX5412246.1 error-prone DNA polymerase [Rhodobacterales bacterium]
MFAELCITSNFTFLTGASHPEEFMQRAASLGITAIAIADQDTVAGIVRAHAAARDITRQVTERQAHQAQHGLIGPPDPARMPDDQGPRFTCPRLIPAATLHLAEGLVLTALPENRTGWAHLCRLLTLGRRRAPKGGCDLRLSDLEGQTEGLHLLLHPPTSDGGAGDWLPQARALTRRYARQMHLVMAPR